MPQQVLLAIEAMSELDRMAQAAANHGFELTVLAENPGYYGDTTFAKVVRFPTRDAKAVRSYIAEQRHTIAQVFSVTDTWGVLASQLRDEFQFLQLGSTENLKNLRDKRFVQEHLVNIGLAGKEDRWPRVVKLRGGTGKLGVHIVNSQGELDSLVATSALTLADYVQQPLHYGPMYSAEVWRDDTQFAFFGVTNRILDNPPSFLEKVKSFPWAADTAWEQDVKTWARKILEGLNYNFGLAHVEFIETRDGFELVEINCRMPGAMITPGIVASTNFDPYTMVVEQALGVAVTIPPVR